MMHIVSHKCVESRMEFLQILGNSDDLGTRNDDYVLV